MAAMAYAMGFLSITATQVLQIELESESFETHDYGTTPRWLAEGLVKHAVPLLLGLVPIALSTIVVRVRDRGDRQLAAILGMMVVTGILVFLHGVLLDWGRYRSPWAEHDDFTALFAVLYGLGAFVIALPLAPILHHADDGDAVDHSEQSREKVHSWLVLNMVLHLLFFAALFPRTTVREVMLSVAFASPTIAFLVYGIVEMTRARRALASVRWWIRRARAGMLPGVSVRVAEGHDRILLPALIATPAYDDVEVIEICGTAGVYREASTPQSLCTIPAP